MGLYRVSCHIPYHTYLTHFLSMELATRYSIDCPGSYVTRLSTDNSSKSGRNDSHYNRFLESVSSEQEENANFGSAKAKGYARQTQENPYLPSEFRSIKEQHIQISPTLGSSHSPMPTGVLGNSERSMTLSVLTASMDPHPQLPYLNSTRPTVVHPPTSLQSSVVLPLSPVMNSSSHIEVDSGQRFRPTSNSLPTVAPPVYTID